jgi:signal transduction histidine kinase
MIAQVARIDHVLTQLRSLASLEVAEEAAMVPVDLVDLVIATVADLTPPILASGRTIEVRGTKGGIVVLGNAGLIRMALTNLIENAAIHTPAATHIEVALEPPGVIVVADNGPGIAEDEVPRLLRRFHRADHTRSDGAGLGLSIVQRIAEAHHGRLETGRAPQGGARFAISFTAARS